MTESKESWLRYYSPGPKFCILNASCILMDSQERVRLEEMKSDERV